MAGQHLVQLHLVTAVLSLFVHTHWSISLGVPSSLGKWQKCDPG